MCNGPRFPHLRDTCSVLHSSARRRSFTATLRKRCAACAANEGVRIIVLMRRADARRADSHERWNAAPARVNYLAAVHAIIACNVVFHDVQC